MRAIGIPGFGILIPNFTGLFGDFGFGDPEYWLGYVYFIFLAFLIWQGNRYFLFQQRTYLSWFSRPFTKMFLLVFSNIYYTAPLTVLFIWLWYAYSGVGPVDWNVIQMVALINVICVLFVAHGYETIFLIRERQNDMTEIERLEKTRAVSELEALKQQVDPHFMFNSLNTLAFLIENDPDRALEYNHHLADVYRYILMNKERDLVLLREELTFLDDYFFLLELRFGNSIALTKTVQEADVDQFLVPPLALQLLVENAVKHNEFSAEEPLHIRLEVVGEELTVKNAYRPRTADRPSFGIGLDNLSERCELLTGKRPEFGEENGHYLARIPLLKSSNP